ncbi:hypothetical protein Goari_018913, partial [Gossypium aridum]|nr:hypothetical protein [Gossypium aridum]
ISNLILVSGQCQNDQKQLLLELNLSSNFNSTAFPTPLERLMKWNQTTDCCSWEGVSCDAGGHVIGFDLSGREISSAIDDSSSLFSLQHLRQLNLALNLFMTAFPTRFLQVLSMSDCYLSGPIHSSLSKLRSLSVILLDRNNLSGLIPQFFTKFPNLTCLSLSSVNFSGPIPSFSSSINLRDLILALNQLNGTIHSTDWSGLSKLEIIGLGNNKLSGTIPPTLFGIPSLRTLSLSHNQFNGSIGDFHGKASSLINTLDLSNNMLQGQFPMFVFELHGLTSLNLSSNNFCRLIPVSAFQNLRNLSALGLSYNRWSIDATTVNISSLSFPTLAELDLASCNLIEFPGFLKNGISLHVLDLSKNQIHGKIPDWIWKPIDLARLNLSQNFLLGFERPLKNIASSVEILDLHGNQLQGEIPILSNAAYLDYSNNNFNSVLPAQIGDSLQYAFFFSLSNNNIQGSISESICNSKYLEVLDLSNNSLSGPIPQCLFQMNRSLGVLNLRRNNLSGIISDTSSKSCQLQTLNLNQNRLEGKVPNSLVNCKMVKLLDIGNNHINDSFPCHLKNIATLRVVVLRSNKFNGYIDCPGNNSGWQMLQILNLASNNFSGKLHLTCLETWDAMQPNPDKNQSELEHLQCEDLRSGVKYQDAITITIKGLELELVKIL